MPLPSHSALIEQGEPAAGSRVQEIWLALAPVTDPELDESVTELGFVTAVQVSGTAVGVRFHLPTYWCAANFAYLMAYDMRQAVLAVPWVESVSIELAEHMYADTINKGIDAGLSFQDTFGDEANGELHEVREKFRRKSFQQRQEVLLRYLLDLGQSPEQLVSMSVNVLAGFIAADADSRRMFKRYQEARAERGFDRGLLQRAFVTIDGEVLDVTGFQAYLRELRGVRINTQFNGEMCRGLLQARYGNTHTQPTEVFVDVPKPGQRVNAPQGT